MTEYEALDAVFSANAAMHSSFQYWLSITFAVIVMAHLARQHLTKLMICSVAVLYFCASALFYVDYLHWLAIMESIDQDRQLPQLDRNYGTAKVWLRTTLFIAGPTVAISYLLYSYRNRHRSEALDTVRRASE
jgi:hypothetical protein